MTASVPPISLGPVEIMALIPHRHPFFLLDAVEILEVGLRARGTKAVTMSEPALQGHFPSEPVFPGVLMAEALAQTGATLLGHAEGLKNRVPAPPSIGYLARVDLKFLAPVRPGQVLRLDVKKTAQVDGLVALACVAEVAGTPVVEGRISVALTPART